MIVIPENKTVPPSDAIKTGVIASLESIQESYNDLLYYFYMHKRRRTVEAKFQAMICSFYGLIRPKILDHINYLKEVGSETNSDLEDYSNLVVFMDRYIEYPSRFTIEEAVEVYKWLNQFCEEYGLTKTAFRQAQIPGISDIPRIN